MKVEIRHIKALGYCNRGARRWLEQHKISWQSFVKNGIESVILRASGDAMAIKAAELAEKEHGIVG